MSTSTAKVAPAKKSKSANNDFVGRNNSTKKSEGDVTSVASVKNNSSKNLSAFYSSGPVASLSPSIQAKFIQLKETSDENDIEPIEESNPAQLMCDECEAEEKETESIQSKVNDSDSAEEEDSKEGNADDVVQMWNCDDYPEPTCSIQTKEDHSSSVQFMCPECEAEENQAEDDPSATIQTQSEEENNSEEGVEESADEAVQMWDCGDYPEPTCTIQQNDDSNIDQEMESEEAQSEAGSEESLIQSKCAACVNEEDGGEGVQQRSAGGKRSNKRGKLSIVKQANEGLQNAHSPLPHQDRIQESFGHHDISDVRTETGGSAGRASKNIGALAYASGNKIGFRRTPSLHLAAHEAAHTVQQRAGLKLPGNVGKPGDPWERHADQVADAVVTGESAEPLLDSVAPPANAASQNVLSTNQVPDSSAAATGGTAAPQVQGNITSGATHHTESEEVEEEEEAATEGGGAEAESEAGGAKAAEEKSAENTDETAATTAENEADPAADCEEAKGDDDSEANKKEPAAGGGEQEAQQPAGPPEKGRCYVADSPDPPEGSQEPSGDAPPNESKAEAEVTYGDWEESNDECDCGPADTMPPNAAEQEVGTATPLATEAGTPAQSSDKGVAGGARAEGGEASAEGSGGGAGGGESEESSEGNFAQGEASRDLAVAEFDTAISDVNRVPDRARKLSKGLRFNAAPAGDAAEEAQRAMALRQISSFMQNATSQIDSAISFVRDEASARLGAMADAVKANIESAIRAEKGAISARINLAKAAAVAEAEVARNTINTDYETQVASVTAETDAAVQTLTNVHISSTGAIDEREETALSEVNTRFQTGRDAHDAKGTTFANAAVATGQDWSDSYSHCRAERGNDYEHNGDDGFWDGCLTVRRAKAQQDAACNTAGGMAKNMVDVAKKKGFDLRDQRTQHRCSVIAAAGSAQTTLDTTLAGMISGLENGRVSTLDGLSKARDANLRGVDVSLEARFQSLDQQAREQRQAVNDSGYVQQVAVEQMAHQVATGLVKSVSAATESLEQKLMDLREQLLEGEVPSPEQLSEVLSSAEEGMADGVGSLLEKMEEGASNAEMSIIQSGETAATALADITNGNSTLTAESEQGYSAELNTLVSAASDSMAQLADSHIANALESTATGTQSMDQVVNGFIETTEGIYSQVDQVISTSLGELDTELIGMAEGLGGKIAAEAWRAASKEQPAWKGVVAIVLIILIIIVSIIVTVLTAGAAAAALGPILGAAVLGAVVGAVTAGLIQVINNWAAGEELTKGLVQAIVMGAVGGAIGGAIGAGANGLAQVGVNAAIKAGSSTLTRAAINVGVNLAGDMVAEGATQAFGYFKYGQQLNWQGFVTAGAMSVASTGRGAGGAAGKYDADASLSSMFRPTGAAGPRPRLQAPTAADAAVGLGIAAGVEGLSYLETGKFDANRFATSAAGGVGGAWASGLANRNSAGGGDTHNAATPRPQSDTPSTPRPVTPAVDTPSTPRPAAPDVDTPSTPRPAAPDVDTPTAPRPAAPDVDTPASPRPTVPDTDAPTTPRPVAPDADTPATPRPTEPDGPDSPRRPNDGVDPETRPQSDAPQGSKARSADDGDLGSIGGQRITAELELPGNKRLKVLEDGSCVICASPCRQISLNYAADLAENPRLAMRLERIENSLRRNPDQPRVMQAANEIRTQLEAGRVGAPDRIRSEYGNELRTRPDLAAELDALQVRIREKPANQRLQRRLKALQNQLNTVRNADTFVPQTTSKQRIDQTPKSNGRWGAGGRGESKFTHENPDVNAKLQEFGQDGITYRNGFPDFSPVTVKQFEVESIGNTRSSLHSKMDSRLANDPDLPTISGGHFKAGDRVTATQVGEWRSQNKLTWHEHQNMTTVQLVPTIINGKFGHVGGFGEQNAMNANNANNTSNSD